MIRPNGTHAVKTGNYRPSRDRGSTKWYEHMDPQLVQAMLAETDMIEQFRKGHHQDDDE